jgi:C4-dicarboxylate-specific signal transduction histidine kinase
VPPTPPGALAPAGPAALGPPSEVIALELAHQIKNPLVAVKAFVRSIAELASPPADLLPLCEQTDEAIRRMDGAVEELLAFARLGPPRLGAVDAVDLLRAALREVWPDFASKDVAVTGPNGAALRVVGDEEHLRQALATLARHLLESIEPRSAIEIAVDRAGEIRLRYRESGATTHLLGVGGLDRENLPLALLLVRGALAPGGGTLEVSRSEGHVEVALRFATG